MHLSTIISSFLAGATFVAAAPAKRATDPIPVEYVSMLNSYQSYVNTTLSKKDHRNGLRVCNHRNVQVRKEWRSMSKRERKKYVSAVQCMYRNRRSQANRKKVPGARNRLDDFLASHLVVSEKIHFNGHLFPWHRHFVWLYEQALREECGYKGAQPYWDWTLDAGNLLASPVFDGSDTSMGGNGEYFPHGHTELQAFGLDLQLPPGTGGGCLKSGPFSDLIVNMGLNQTIAPPASNVTAPIPKTLETADNKKVEPLSSPETSNITSPVDPTFETEKTFEPVGLIKFNEALNYNPRCLRRDLNLFWAEQLTASHVLYLLQASNADQLEKRIDGWDGPDPTQPAMHPAGHFVVGGLQNDPFASPGDPMFFLIHAQIDRLYTIWQSQDPARLYQVGGTDKPLDLNNEGNPVKLNDRLNFGIVDGKRKLKNLLNTMDKYYCYAYE
ncbi:Di-copper centre-containing protein [Lojkania enalia]|uniref:Di-copper centre-containing protein n=1 Tax=Lojkania enalia TaxID=147567 RepID=A0A9P4K276_9PLEO|nr:Di-copper centre-containing protein [Didymosphaeria enalia]